MKKTSEILKLLNKKFGEGIIVNAKEIEENLKVEKISSGILTIDILLNGGFPKSSIITLYGEPSSGKSLISLIFASQLTNKKKNVAVVDLENSYDPEWCKKLGVDSNYLYVSQPDIYEKAIDIADTLVRSKEFSLVILDSITSGIPEEEMEKSAFDQQMALQARLNSKLCVDGDQEIILPNGIVKKFKNLQIGDPIIVKDSTTLIEGKVVDFFYTGKKECFLVNDSISLTGDHKVLTLFGLKDVRKIKAGDILVKCLKTPFFNRKFLDSQEEEEVLGFLLGYILGDGCYRPWGGFSVAGDEYLYDYLKKWSKVFNCNVIKRKIDGCYNYRIIKNNKLPKGSYRNPIRKLLRMLNIDFSIKEIPEFIFYARKEVIKNLLTGLFDSDGTVVKRAVEFSTQYYIWARQVQFLLQKFGIFSRIIKSYNKRYKKDYYKVQITSRPFIELFEKEIGFLHPKKKEKLRGLITSYKHKTSSKQFCLPIYILMLLKSIVMSHNLTKNLKQQFFPIGKIKNLNNKSQKRVDTHNLTWIEAKKIFKTLGIEDEYIRLFGNDCFTFEEVKSVKSVGIKDVYDITVSTNEGIFSCNSYLIHNCKKIFSALQPENLKDKSTYNNTIIMLIAHLRQQVGILYGNPNILPGGYAIKHASSVILYTKGGEWYSKKDKIIGRQFKLKLEKSKVSLPHTVGVFDFYFEPPKIDNFKTLILYAIQLGIIKQAGAFYSYKDIKVRGKEELIKILKEKKELIKEIKQKILEVK